MKKNKGLFVGILLSVITLVAFGGTYFVYKNKNMENTAKEQLKVVTSFYPMYIATMNVCDGMDGIILENLSEPETGCLHDYQLTPADMKLLSTADVFVVNGGGIEEFLTDVAKAYPNLTIVDASEDLDLLEDNSHAWMSVSLHEQQVENIAQGLAKADPDRKEEYLDNARNYEGMLQMLEAQIQEVKEVVAGKSVVIFHEAYEYVAEEYGLNVSYVMDLDEERQVSAGEVAEVMSAIADHNVSVVFAEETYGKEMGDLVDKETDATTIYLETLVRGQYDKDSYLTYMQQNIDRIKEAFAG